MCTKKEVEDAISFGIAPLVTSMGYIETAIAEIKETLKHPPCQDHGDKITRLESEFKSLKESSDKFEVEKNEEIYPRLRAAETSIARMLVIWPFVLILITAMLNWVGWYFRK